MGTSTVATTEQPLLTHNESEGDGPRPLPRHSINSYETYDQKPSNDNENYSRQHDIPKDTANQQQPQEQNSHENQSASDSNTGSTTPVDPPEEDEDTSKDFTNDLQFKKKDLKKPRTQSFQLVLSTASLKSLRQADTSNPPALARNSSNLGNMSMTSTGNHKNFQSFIQAPVLSSVTNLRALDNIAIGQQLPFDQRDPPSGTELNRLRHDSHVSQTSTQPVVKDDRDDDDEYREETTLQQQKLTLNALKKLSLSLAPIIRSDEETGPESRQLTTKLLNGLLRPESKLEKRKEENVKDENKNKLLEENRAKPYQPAQVDLSLFASLTRQNKHLSDSKSSQSTNTQTSQTKENQAGPNPSERDYHIDMQRQMLSMQNQTAGDEPAQKLFGQTLFVKPLPVDESKGRSLQSQGAIKHSNLNLHSHKLQQSQSQSLMNTPQAQHLAHSQSQGQSQSSENELHPVVPPMDMNVRNRKASQADDNLLKHSSLADKRIQQIKGFRNPMYIPAVLRKTLDEDADLGPISSNLTDTGRESYFEGLSRVGLPSREQGSSSNSVRSVDLTENKVASPSLTLTGPYTLNKKQYEYILRAAPTKKHWVKDEAVSECGIASCRKHFNFFERRHHCRRCGGIFCKEHTLHYLYINHLAQFTTGGRGTLSRVCDNCIEEYNDFMKEEFGVTCHRPRSSMDVTTIPQEETEPLTPQKPVMSPRIELLKYKNPHPRPRNQMPPQIQAGKGYPREEPSSEQVAGSVPANWSWSSF